MKNGKKIVVSACLAGVNCKYDGGNNENHKIMKMLSEEKIVLICPEELGGLPTPRIPCENVLNRVITENGVDVTEQFQNGAYAALKVAKDNNIDTAILQKRSPSCGSKQVYDGTFSGKLIKGKGLTAKLFEENGIKVLTIDDI